MWTDPKLCVPPFALIFPSFFLLPSFTLRFLTAKCLHSSFGVQYVIPGGNQKLSFKRWPLLTSDPEAFHPAAPLLFCGLHGTEQPIGKMGAESIAIHRPPLCPSPPPEKEKRRKKMNESHSSISRRGRRKLYWLKASEETGKATEKEFQGKEWRGVWS